MKTTEELRVICESDMKNAFSPNQPNKDDTLAFKLGWNMGYGAALQARVEELQHEAEFKKKFNLAANRSVGVDVECKKS